MAYIFMIQECFSLFTNCAMNFIYLFINILNYIFRNDTNRISVHSTIRMYEGGQLFKVCKVAYENRIYFSPRGIKYPSVMPAFLVYAGL
jgi:hypothetical protein